MKNLLLLALMLFALNVVQAQLYVQPNGATDSYVYVKDQILFVEQDINLTANPTATEEPSIYLRDEAQLIQGNTSSANSGNGSISVLQNTPFDDSWDYTYWCSPVGNVVSTGNRSFGVSRLNDYQTVKSSNLALITNNLNGVESPLTISKKWIYRHPRGQEALNDYLYVANGNTVPPGHGFTMKGVGTTNHDQVYDFRGRAYNGTMTLNIYNNEWTLSGNPYPSALDLNAVFWDADNSEISEFWYYDEDRNVDSHLYSQKPYGYGTYVPGALDPGGLTENGLYTPATFSIWDSNGTETGGSYGSGALYDRRFAPIGQGFMIVGGATGPIMIKNIHRRYVKEGNASDFRNPLGGNDDDTSNDDSAIPQIRINTYFVGSSVRQILLAFSEQSSDTYDRGWDGQSPMDASSEVFFPVLKENIVKPFVINTIPFNEHKQVPLTFKLDQEHTVKLEGIDQNKLKFKVYLFDRISNSLQEISNGQTATVFLNEGTYEGRFYIVFEDPRVSPTITQTRMDEIKGNINLFQNNPAKQLELTNPESYDIKEVNIFDMSGKLVYIEKNVGNSNRYTFPTYNFSDGVYLVKLNTNDNLTIDYKINVFNK
jgi:Secretion system C-terminal sorting domain